MFKQWPLAGEFSKFEYSPKIRQIFVTRSGEFGEHWANFCDSLRRIWRVLSKFSEFSEFGESGKFGEDRLDCFIPKNIFFLYIKWPSFKIRQICQIRQIRQNAVTDSPDSPTFAKGHFWKNVTRIRHIRTSNSPFSRIWGEWPLLNFVPSPKIERRVASSKSTLKHNIVKSQIFKIKISKCVLPSPNLT